MTHLQNRRARPVRPGAPLGAFVAMSAIVVLALGACGDAAGPGQSAPPQPPSQTPASTSGPTPSSTASEVTPVPGQRERRVPWRLVDAGPGPGVVVEVKAGGPPCDVVTHLDVDETPSGVRLDVWAGREPGAVCVGVPALLGTVRVRVPLAEPLGSRPLTPRSV
jgi:hypothetical protein